MNASNFARVAQGLDPLLQRRMRQQQATQAVAHPAADAEGLDLLGQRGLPVVLGQPLQRLGQNQGHSTLPSQVQAFGISGAVGHGLRRLFLTHPPLEERIQTLRNAPVEQVRGTVVG